MSKIFYEKKNNQHYLLKKKYIHLRQIVGKAVQILKTCQLTLFNNDISCGGVKVSAIYLLLFTSII